MYRTLTAGLTALSLILVPAAPVQAQTSNAEMQRTILGLLAIGGVALAIKNQQDRDKRARQSSNPQPRSTTPQRAHDNHGHRNTQRGWGQQQTRRQVDLVPGRCFRQVELANGRHQGVFGARCLDRRYRDAHTLPNQCRVRMGGPNGSRRGYDARCLRDFGYRSDRRWN